MSSRTEGGKGRRGALRNLERVRGKGNPWGRTHLSRKGREGEGGKWSGGEEEGREGLGRGGKGVEGKGRGGRRGEGKRHHQPFETEKS